MAISKKDVIASILTVGLANNKTEAREIYKKYRKDISVFNSVEQMIEFIRNDFNVIDQKNLGTWT